MKYISILAVLCGLFLAGSALAEERPKNIGFGFDLGVPSGAALGLTVKPNIKWMRFELDGTYGLAPGIRGGVTLDPINWAISPSFTFEAGHSFMGHIPTKSAEVDVTYYNLHAGLEFGSQRSFRFFLHGGPSYIILHGSNLESLLNNTDNVKLTNSSVRGWIAPTATMGFVLFL